MKLMRFKIIYFVISLLILIPSTVSLIIYGVKPAIDFTGGALLEISITANEGIDVNETSIRETIGSEYEIHAIQQTGQGTSLLRTKSLTQEEKQKLIGKIQNELGEIEERRFETVGPTIGKELLTKTVTATVIASIFILLFVAYRFKEIKYGVCAIVAMFHDTVILLGMFSLLGHFANVEVDTLFVTAVLTTLSFSVHDTIVVYDRIRESLRRYPKASFEDIVNLSVAETLGRSLNNSMTIIFMLVSLFLMGGVTIHWFVLALLIGTIAGTYSSTFTAAPLLVVWENLKTKKH